MKRTLCLEGARDLVSRAVRTKREAIVTLYVAEERVCALDHRGGRGGDCDLRRWCPTVISKLSGGFGVRHTGTGTVAHRAPTLHTSIVLLTHPDRNTQNERKATHPGDRDLARRSGGDAHRRSQAPQRFDGRPQLALFGKDFFAEHVRFQKTVSLH